MPPHIIVCPKPIYEDFQAIYAIKTAAGILSAACFVSIILYVTYRFQ